MAQRPGALPLRDAHALTGTWDRLLDPWLELGGLTRAAFPVDVYETRDAIVTRAYLPQVQPEDVQVQLTASQLVIRARRREHPVPAEAVVVRRELAAGDMVRTFDLNVPVNAAAVRADLTDGVLEVVVPKAESIRPRTIPVTGPKTAAGSGPARSRAT